MAKQKSETNGKATVIITYNSVNDYPAGTYQGKHGPVVIYSNDNSETWDDRAEGMLSSVLHGIYGRVNPEDVGKVYLYVGLHARRGALRAAESFSHGGNNLTVVACNCDSEIKSETATRLNAPIIWSECGGRRTLKEIVKKELA